jgi:hypothetical protein
MQGRVENVWVHTVGTYTVAAAAASDELLYVNGVSDLALGGGVVVIDSVAYNYVVDTSTTDVNGNRTDILELSPPLTAPVTVDTPVIVNPEAETKIAQVRLTDGSATDSLFVQVPHALFAYFPTLGIRTPDEYELVNFQINERGEYVMTDVLGKAPTFDPLVVEGLDELLTITLPDLQSQLDELNTVTLPALQADVDSVDAEIGVLNTTTLPGLTSDLNLAESDIVDLQDKFPITAPDIASNAITDTKIATDAVTTPKLFANAVTAAKVATNTLTANEIAANAIATSELAALSVTAAKIVAHTITANEIAADTITANEIAANAITANELAANSVTALKISASAVIAGKLAADSVIAGNIAADVITAREVQAGAITAVEIAAGTLEAGFVLAGRVQVGIDTWTPNEGLIFPGRMVVSAPYAQLITINGAPTGGTFTLTADGVTTSTIAYNAASSAVQTAVRALGPVWAAATVTGSAGGPYTVSIPATFPSRRLAPSSSLTGGTSPSVAVSDLINPPSFTGGITATSLTVQKDFNLLGLSNQIKGSLTLANGIVPPTVPPTMWQSWDSPGARSMPFGAINYGLDQHLSNSNLLVTAAAFFGGNIDFIDKTTGGAAFSLGSSGWGSNFNPTGGIATLGSFYYVLGIDSSRTDVFGYPYWYIYRIDSSGNKQGEIQVGTSWSGNPPYFNTRPALGKDESTSQLLIAFTNSSADPFTAGGPGQLIIYRNTPANTAGGTFTWGTTSVFNTFPGISGYNFSSIRGGNFDFGAFRYVMSLEGNANFVFDSSGNRASDVQTFSTASGGTVRGLHWDGSKFWSEHTDGSLWIHGPNLTAETDTASYTWYDGDTSSGSVVHETTPSPPATFSRSARTFLNIQTELAPDSGVTDVTQRDKANRVGIYAATGANTRRLQQYNGVDGSGITIRTLKVGLINTGGQTETTPTGFLGATNSPGLISSFGAVAGVNGFRLNGDGSVSLGTFQMNADGTNILGKNLADSGWLNMTLINSWVNYDSGLATGGTGRTAQYRKIDGVVYFRGYIRSGTVGTKFWAPPAGFRPELRSPVDHAFPVVSNSAFGSIGAGYGGTDYSFSVDAGNAAWVNLDGVRYVANS